MIKDCVQDKKNPIYFLRFEDLVADPKKTLSGLFAFLLDLDDISGTNIETRIDEVISKGKEATISYKIKDTTRSFNSHAKSYTEAQLDYIKNNIGHQLYYFGYVNHPEDKNDTSFFEFAEHSEDNLSQYLGFKRVNEESLKEVTGSKLIRKYHVNKENIFPLLPKDVLPRVQEPSRDWATKKLGLEKTGQEERQDWKNWNCREQLRILKA